MFEVNRYFACSGVIECVQLQHAASIPCRAGLGDRNRNCVASGWAAFEYVHMNACMLVNDVGPRGGMGSGSVD